VTRLWVDANVILRFLTGEPQALAEKAAHLMARAERGEVVLVLPALVIAEILWVLKSFYQRTIGEIEGVLVPLMTADGLEVEDRDLLIEAIGLAREKNVDFVDAILALRAARSGEPVCSFDGDFKHLPAAWAPPT